MDVKGTAFLARKVMLIEEIGEERFNQLVSEMARKEPIFSHPIHATTLIPLRVFVAFNDALIDELYGGDRSAYLRFGEKSAEYALTIGPYKRIRETNSIAVLTCAAHSAASLTRTAGRSTARS